MSLDVYQQIHQLLDEKKNILITCPKKPSGDAIGSALALLLFLEKSGKSADIVCDDFSLPKQFSFLKKSNVIHKAFSNLQKFFITLDVKDTGVQELSYDLKDDKLRIFITPKKGTLTRDHVRTAQSDFKYDLIFTIGSEDLPSLGTLYDSNTDLFHKTTVVNIDHHTGNEHYGQINLVDLTATSTAEIVFDLLKKIGEEYLDDAIATSLLTGIIAETHSFKSDNVRPHTLAIAGKLMSLGANRDNIVQSLYRTRSIATLKLWGVALTHMQSDKNLSLVWTSITRDDFTRLGASEHDITDVIDELISNSPEAKVILLTHEHSTANHTNNIHALLTVDKAYNAHELLTTFNPTGNAKQASCVIEGKTLKDAEEVLLQRLRSGIGKK